MIQPADFEGLSIDDRLDLADAIDASIDPAVAARIQMESAELNVLLQRALQLSVDERIELVGSIWNGVAGSQDEIPIPDWLGEELDRREAEVDADPDEGVPWEVLRQELRERFR